MGKLSQKEAINRLESGNFSFEPFTVSLKESEVQKGPNSQELDAVLEISWDNTMKTFVAEYLQVSTPKALQSKVSFVKNVTESISPVYSWEQSFP